MQAVLCRSFGPPESLTLETVPDPEPGPGEVVVDVAACSLNFPDVLMVEGKYQSLPPFPFSPGGDIAGVVQSTGAGVDRWQPGDRVFGGIGHGGFAERVSVNAGDLRPVPDTMAMDVAAAISTTYGTSYYALKQRANLQPGENLLVLGAAGGVGLAAVELGKAMGARVIAAASSATKLDAAARAGADELINYSGKTFETTGLKDAVKALTDGRGADVIYDPVGGHFFDQCMRSINWYGRVLVIGFVGGDIPRVPINLILLKSCQVVGVFYGAWAARFPEERDRNFQEILDMYTQKRIDPLVGRTYAMSDYADALRCLSGREALGKVVLRIQ